MHNRFQRLPRESCLFLSKVANPNAEPRLRCHGRGQKQVNQRRFLFLQGPSSPFMGRVAEELRRLGHDIRRINLCPGDALFWRAGKATMFRGGIGDWPAYLEGYLERKAVTDLVLFSDSRPYQSLAIPVARSRGLGVHVIEHGYLRPDWITVERDGFGVLSRFPRTPDDVLRLAGEHPMPSFDPIERESFLRFAVWDVAYHGANVALGWVVSPRYQRYMLDHPIKEYAGWIMKLLRARATARRADATVTQAVARPGPLFVVPLQLATDFQIRAHSPFPHLRDAVRWVIRSFAANAAADATLLLKVHPLDAGWERWPRQVAALATAAGVGERVLVADGGSLEALLARADGVVTVNSTVGLTALRHGVPLTVLGNAIYDIDGLTDRRPLADFWRAPEPPDQQMVAAFLKALAWATQVRGEFTATKSMTIGARAVAERLAEDGERLPPRAPPVVVFARAAEWTTEMRAS